MTKCHRLDLNQRLDCSRETYEDYGYGYQLIGVTDIQLSLEKTKSSLGSFTELPADLRIKTTAKLNFKSNKFNCLRLCITEALYPITADATKENKYFNNIVEDWEEDKIYRYF